MLLEIGKESIMLNGFHFLLGHFGILFGFHLLISVP